jgi:hypothetical protein
LASCANITIEKIRARVSFGPPLGPTSLTFETPDVKNFSVTRTRGTLAAQFSASIEIPANLAIPAGEDLIIEAGVEGNLIRIFTGRVLSVTVNPSFENAARYVINLSGQDRFQELEGKNISRRQRARSLSQFAAITGVTSRAPQKGISFEKRQQSGGDAEIISPDTNLREHSKLVRTDKWDPFNPAKDPEAGEAEQTTSSAATDVIDIKPRSVSLSPGISVLFNIEGSTYESGDVWSVSDPEIGTIQDRQNGTAIYTQLALGENTIQFTKTGADVATTFVGKATAAGIPIHSHASLGEGGPAFGVFSAE